MWHLVSKFQLEGERRQNAYALLAICLAFGWFHGTSDPEACGSDPVSSIRPQARFFLPPGAAQAIVRQAAVAADRATSETALPAQPVPPPGIEAEVAAEPAPAAATEPFAVSSEPLSGRIALESSQGFLKLGRDRLKSMPGYSVVFTRQERIDGCLLDEQTMRLKVRHSPFSLSMRWTKGDKGRQLYYVEGENDGNVLIQPGGFAGRVTGLVPFEPNHDRIRAESRHPATMAGLLAITEKILEHHAEDLARATGVSTELRQGDSFNDRPCYTTTVTYDSAEINPTYRRSVVQIDEELSIPVNVRNYTWTEGSTTDIECEETLIEAYSFSELDSAIQVSDSDFQKVVK